MVIKGLEEALLNGRLGRAVTRVIGNLRFRLSRDTLGVMAIGALPMGLGFARRWSGA